MRVFLEEISHEVSVLAEVGHLIGALAVLASEGSVLLLTVVRGITETVSDPLGHLGDGLSGIKFGVAA